MKLLKRSVTLLLAVALLFAFSGGLSANVAAATLPVTGPNGSYSTLKAAVAASVAGDTLQLNQDMTEDVTIRKNLTLDLNGYKLNGTITIYNGKVVSVKDSSTDDFNCADGYGTVGGKGGSGKLSPADGYIAVTEADGSFSYHRLDLGMSSVSLRSREAGIYYTGNFGGDQVLKSQIASYGVILSVAQLPTAAEFLSGNYQGKHTAFTGDSWVCGESAKANGTLLSGILKETNTQAANAANSVQNVNSVAYVRFNDGTVKFGEAVSVNLMDVTQNIDKVFDKLNAAQLNAILGMYQKFQTVMDSWDIPNLRDFAANRPALTLSSASVKAGATATVKISLENNPGILGAIFSISYDSSALTLTGAANGVTADGVKYTAPSRFKDPTYFLWDAIDPTWTEDGTVLTLTFKVASNAKAGNYEVILNYDPGDIFDADGDPIHFAVTNATIEVK